MPDEPSDKGQPTPEEIEERLRRLEENTLRGMDDKELEEEERRLMEDLESLEDVDATDPREQRLQELAEPRPLPEDPFDAEFQQRLDRLHERARKVKAVQESKREEKFRQLEQDRDSARGLGMGLTIAYTIIGVPILGALIGWMIDQNQGTTNFKGFGILIGCVVGIAAAFYLLNRSNSRS